MSNKNLSETIQTLTSCLEGYQRRAAKAWEGREKEAVIALTRVLDCVAVSDYWGMSRQLSPLPPQEMHRKTLLMGAAPALRPFLSLTKNMVGGVPFGPAHPDITRFAYSYLNSCGELMILKRIASLERYGLADTELVDSGHFKITVSPPMSEWAAKYSRKLQPPDGAPPVSANERKLWNRLHARMKRYVQTAKGSFIRYDNDFQIINGYRQQAKSFGKGYLESEALPDKVIIGDRSFGAWKEVCDQAVGRILTHMDFALFLHRKNPSISLDNILTMFVRKDDAEAVLLESGVPADQIKSTMKALTLEFDDLDDWEQAYEVPSVFYIDLGKDFLLLPCFGALMNPYFAMFRHLRSYCRADWDRAVDLREDVFRNDLATVFPQPRFIIPEHGFKLRRRDGSVITDIDALILDEETGDLALVQLKWHDIFGLSLKERESRRRNIAHANQWVERVHSWIDDRSSQRVLSELGVKGQASSRPPVLYVLARYNARFSGDHVNDKRAAWLGWGEVMTAFRQSLPGARSPLLEIPDWITANEQRFEKTEIESQDFQFPGLTVTLNQPVSRV